MKKTETERAMVDLWECGLNFQRLKSESESVSMSVNVFHLLFADEGERERERWW